MNSSLPSLSSSHFTLHISFSPSLAQHNESISRSSLDHSQRERVLVRIAPCHTVLSTSQLLIFPSHRHPRGQEISPVSTSDCYSYSPAEGPRRTNEGINPLVETTSVSQAAGTLLRPKTDYGEIWSSRNVACCRGLGYSWPEGSCEGTVFA